MTELMAIGPEPGQRWRRVLPANGSVCLGRWPRQGWSVPWDNQISREHAELTCEGDGLTVRRLPKARNPVFYRGAPHERFTLRGGEHFVIGATCFQLLGETVTVDPSGPSPREQQTFPHGDLRRARFRNADHRLEVLSHLPQAIGQSQSDDELYVRLVSLLLAGIGQAEAAALVRRVTGTTGPRGQVEVMQWDRRRDAVGPFRPSQRLVLQALEQNESVLHVWSGPAEQQDYTASEQLDWAFCTPVRSEACRHWALYVAGCFGHGRHESLSPQRARAELKGDLRFAELFAELIGSLRRVALLERDRARLSQFFSPRVLETLSRDRSEQALEPKEAEVTVLFCDLRGFSREAEHWRHNLSGLLNRVSEALGVVTYHILEHGGVIGDFQGDAAMGFWGWPLPAADGALGACRAALCIQQQFQQAAEQRGHPLADFRVGIGIAHGRAVAGKIGTADQVKVTVFGPVVNLASRLEGMTRILRVPILLDEATAEFVRQHMPADQGRCRCLGRMRPYGMETPIMVGQLLPPADQDHLLSDQHLRDNDAAVQALLRGNWSEALELLHRLPAHDRAKDFLTIFIAQHNYEPPANWDGVIPMPTK